MNEDVLKTLLRQSKIIIEQHKEEAKTRGEDFNIFSVLGMETSETKTHSGMLVALLNPRENHYFEEQFLRLFLKEIGYKCEDENLKRVTVQAEYHLGKIKGTYASGGYIDILLTFPSGKTITIENKIYAGDQPSQLYRYSLFNKGKSSLYYLNLFGEPPSSQSLQSLKEENFEIISYSDHVLGWLEKCLSIVKSGSIIENSIKQYQILLKRLTNTMENHLEDKLKHLILHNLEESKYIYSHYQKVVDEVKEKFRLAVFERLKEIKWDFDVHLGNDVNSTYSQIWIDNKENKKQNIRFGIETFSGKSANNGRLFVGILNKNAEFEDLKDGDKRLNSYWPVIRNINTIEKNPLNLSSSNIIIKLSSDEVYFNEMVITVVEQSQLFIADYSHQYLHGMGLSIDN